MDPDFIRIFEVGPRDGLQNQTGPISRKDKIQFVNLLSRCGFKNIEVTSFVNPERVPQMADARDVMSGITRFPAVSYSALTPNLKGFERAKSAGADEVAVFVSATETFSQKNTNCSIAESLQRMVPIMDAARAENMPVRGYVSCIAGCPYEGDVSVVAVAGIVERLLSLGCYEVSLGDTIGTGTPETISAMLEASLEVAPAHKLAGHFHDTNGRGLENIRVSLEYGLGVFDAAIAGLGGCPFAPGAKGNVATSDVIEMLHSLGYTTEINSSGLSTAEQFIIRLIEHKTHRDVLQTGS